MFAYQMLNDLLCCSNRYYWCLFRLKGKL